MKRRNEAQYESNKKQRLEDTRTQEEKLKDSAVPLWRLSQEEQVSEHTLLTILNAQKLIYWRRFSGKMAYIFCNFDVEGFHSHFN